MRNVTISLSLLVVVGCAGTRVGGARVGNAEEDSLARAEAMDHYLSATIHMESGDLYQAATELQMALLADPNSTSIPIELGKVYMRLNEPMAALRTLDAAHSRNPDNPEILKALAELSLRSGDLEGSSKYYRKLSKVHPLEQGELMRQIVLSHRAGRLDDALNACKEYLTRFPPSEGIYEQIALIHIARQDFEAADTAFRKQIAINPLNHRIQFVLGGFCVARQQYAEAEVFFKRALALDSSDVRYWSNVLLVLDEQDKKAEYKSILAAAIDRFPEAPQFYDMQAGEDQKAGDLDRALLNADKSIALDSTRISPYMTRGYIYHQRQEWDKSAEAYTKALAIDAENPLVLNNFAYMLSVQNARLDEALQMVEAALKLSPKNPSYRDTKGWILYRLGKYSDALTEVQAAMKDDAENAELYEHLGYILKALGRDSESKQAWMKASELDPNNKEYARLAR